MEQPIVEFVHVSKKYFYQPALRSINLQLYPGGITGVIGPNGSGKTTLLKLIAGLIKPSSGNIFVCGEKPTRRISRAVSYLSDQDAVYPFYNAKQLIRYTVDVSGDLDEQKAFQMFADLQFDVEKKARYLSKGNRAKLRMVLALCRKTPLIVMDEPLAGLDPIVREDLLQLMVKFAELENQTILLSTHEVAEVEPLLDDVLFIKEGAVLFHRPAEEIRQAEGRSLLQTMREATK